MPWHWQWCCEAVRNNDAISDSNANTGNNAVMPDAGNYGDAHDGNDTMAVAPWCHAGNEDDTKKRSVTLMLTVTCWCNYFIIVGLIE